MYVLIKVMTFSWSPLGAGRKTVFVPRPTCRGMLLTLLSLSDTWCDALHGSRTAGRLISYFLYVYVDGSGDSVKKSCDSAICTRAVSMFSHHKKKCNFPFLNGKRRCGVHLSPECLSVNQHSVPWNIMQPSQIFVCFCLHDLCCSFRQLCWWALHICPQPLSLPGPGLSLRLMTRERLGHLRVH